MKFVILFTLVIVVGCALTPLEELEKEASITGDWTEVEWREERIRKRLEESYCPFGQSNVCIEDIEEQSGLQCYCVPLIYERH